MFLGVCRLVPGPADATLSPSYPLTRVESFRVSMSCFLRKRPAYFLRADPLMADPCMAEPLLLVIVGFEVYPDLLGFAELPIRALISLGFLLKLLKVPPPLEPSLFSLNAIELSVG